MRIRVLEGIAMAENIHGLPLHVHRQTEFPLEIALEPCDSCEGDRARGDESRIVYCGVCGKEWHPGERAYPKSFRRQKRGTVTRFKKGGPSLRS